jgi:tRNA G18 (ribose-2'-O)-methylase SpoU
MGLCYANYMKKKKLFLVLHDIRSAYNVGAIFRSADGAGVSKIFLSGYTPCPAHADKLHRTKAEKMIEKTALGAQHSVAWEYKTDLAALLLEFEQNNCAIVGLEKNSRSIDIGTFICQFPAALILGNEVEGISQDIQQKCPAIVSIPMRGEKESLNVSVAASIAMYELLK